MSTRVADAETRELPKLPRWSLWLVAPAEDKSRPDHRGRILGRCDVQPRGCKAATMQPGLRANLL